MPYTVGQSGVANWVNTTLSTVTGVVANGGLGGSGEVVVGGSDRVTRTVNIDLNMQYPTINVSAITGYIAGKTDVIITVGTGVYVYGYMYSAYNGGGAGPYSATMNILGGTTGDTIKLVNNGYILGAGGDGGGAINGYSFGCCCCGYGYQWDYLPSSQGQAALQITYPLILENNGYIAGGGGGGAFVYGVNYSFMGGGGGAGGGIGIDTIGVAAARAVPPNVGNNGEQHTGYYGPCNCSVSYFLSGGGGGFKLVPPDDIGGLAESGSRNSSKGRGGGTGGAGSALDFLTPHTYNNNGGSANNNAPTPTRFPTALISGGGGGWGAAGGQSTEGNSVVEAGQPGGNSIITNGNAITTITAGTQYGAIKTTGTTYVRTLSSSNTPTSITIPGGYTNAIIFIPTGVTVRSNNNGAPALRVTGSQVENLKIIVNGAVLGKGGDGGSESNNPTAGGRAILIDNFLYTDSFTVDCTYGYVAGGGGGGGFVTWNPDSVYGIYGGGGAGGGNSGDGGVNPAYGATVVGTSGSNGTIFYNACEDTYYISGGGGGLIVPGSSVSLGTKNTIASFPGIGGSGGGSGAARKSGVNSVTFANNGGGFNQGGGTQGSSLSQASGGGGGGWGGNGGASKRITVTVQVGGSGGAAIDTGIGLPVYIINPGNVAGQVY